MTEQGLYCAAGRFHIDPKRPVERAVITHAHADHARRGCRHYLACREGIDILRTRLGNEATIQPLPYGKAIDLGGCRLSLHPAGHILGSAQVRIEQQGHVTVFTGDYKRQPDPTCAPFELLRCHCLITESTFGLPAYRWEEPAKIFEDVGAWWKSNQEKGRASILFAYSVGKAQRILMGLDPSMGPIFTHDAVEEMNRRYRMSGVGLPNSNPVGKASGKSDFSRAMILAPPSVRGTSWTRRFGDSSTALASGWMLTGGMRRRRSVDRGFALSDHADWPALMDTIAETGAEEVHVTHGFVDVVVRSLRKRNVDAKPLGAPFARPE